MYPQGTEDTDISSLRMTAGSPGPWPPGGPGPDGPESELPLKMAVSASCFRGFVMPCMTDRSLPLLGMLLFQPVLRLNRCPGPPPGTRL